MRTALNEARKGLGHTSPNPAVGSVLVSDGKIVARGHHRAAGQPHAEVACLTRAKGPITRNAVLYVTLEPCSTTGRTEPCTQAIIAAGIRHVVIGAIDPNPRHSGRGIELLRAAGVKVRSGVLEAECAALIETFSHWIRTRRPFVIAKCGMSLDGRLTRPPGEAQWITSTAARQHAQHLRHQVDAILVGAETVRRDNPRLTARALRSPRQPWRVVLTRSGKLPTRARLFTDRFADRTLIFRNQTLRAVLARLGRNEITSVLIEGGGDVLGQALDGRLIDRVQIYLGSILTGGPVVAFGGRGAASTAQGAHLREVHYEKIGSEIFLSGKPTYGIRSSE